MVGVPVVVVAIGLLTSLLFGGLYYVEKYQSYILNGSPLFLTPLLEYNKILEAQSLSRIKPDVLNTSCFTGYFTVNPECKSNLFFSFCQAQTNWEESPVLLWLQGGPGASSLFGLFKEVGPFYYEDGIAKQREHSWNINNNLLFIDQPVGTGFSFTTGGCYAKSKTDIVEDLYSAITQFFQLFPNLKFNEFYIAGESYAGHYIPYIGHYIHKMKSSAKDTINLKGMMIGNGWMDAYYQYDYTEFFYHIGLLDKKQNETFHQYLLNLRRYLRKNEWSNAMMMTNSIEEIISVSTKDIDVYNFLHDTKNAPPYDNFPEISLLRSSINVGSQEFGRDAAVVYDYLVLDNSYDDLQSVKTELEVLLEHYPIVFYFGQLDTVCPYSVALSFLRELQWSGAADYQQAPRHQWCVEGRLAGFYRSSHNLHDVLVRNAGHSVPLDQPLWAFILADSVTSSPPHGPLHKLDSC